MTLRRRRFQRSSERDAVQELLARTPLLARRIRSDPDSPEKHELALLTAGLVRMPEPLYQVVRLREFEHLRNNEAAARLGVHRNTASRRYLRGLDWLAGYCRAPDSLLRPLRKLEIPVAPPNREVGRSGPLGSSRRRGRPQRIPLWVDVEVVRAYCAGQTQQEIADRLNVEGIDAVGSEWRRSSIRTILSRYNVPRRPSGRRMTQVGYSPGTGKRVDYENTMRGTPICDADALLRKAGVDTSRVAPPWASPGHC